MRYLFTFFLIAALAPGPTLHAGVPQREGLEALVFERALPVSGTHYELHLVPTQDEIYVPIGLRKPEGNGPFPAVLVGAGAGRGGIPVIEDALYRLEPMMDDMLRRGYVLVYTNPRNEAARAYNYLDRPERLLADTNRAERTPRLDSDDYVSVVQYVGALPYVSAVGTVGASHNGELQSKAASEITWDAAVSIEGATHEYLAVDYDKVVVEDSEMQIRTTEVAGDVMDLEQARARVDLIETPFLHIGRTQDSLNGLFLRMHELMLEAGKDSTWHVADHPVHGFGLLYRNADGLFTPDPVQVETYEMWMAFLDKHLKGAETPAGE
jgi:hypothetical protein